MTDEQIFAWIFLTIREQPTPLWGILLDADGINRAEPSLEEFQNSLGWLQAQGLIRKEGKEYSYTEAGAAIWELVRTKMKKKNISVQWDAIAEMFLQLPKVDFQPDAITEKQVAAARRAAHKFVREVLRKLDESIFCKSNYNVLRIPVT